MALSPRRSSEAYWSLVPSLRTRCLTAALPRTCVRGVLLSGQLHGDPVRAQLLRGVRERQALLPNSQLHDGPDAAQLCGRELERRATAPNGQLHDSPVAVQLLQAVLEPRAIAPTALPGGGPVRSMRAGTGVLLGG